MTQERFFPKYDYFLYEAEYQDGNYNITSNKTEYDKNFFTGRGYADIKNEQYIKFKISVEVKNNFSVVLRYSHGVGRLRLLIRGNATSECPEVNQSILTESLQVNNPIVSWESTEKVLLCPGTNYTIAVDGAENNISVKIDSLLLMPDLQDLDSYKTSNKNVRQRSSSQYSVATCLKEATTIQGSMTSVTKCKNVTFSTMVELFNGSLGKQYLQFRKFLFYIQGVSFPESTNFKIL